MFRAIHPGSPSRQKVTESAVLGLKRTRETVVGCFGEEELSLLSHFLFLFLYGCDERFVFCHGSGLPPDCFIGERAVFSLVYINIPGEKDENDAGNQNQYSAPFSPGEIKEFFEGVLHDGLFQKTQFIDKNQCNSYRSNVFQDEYQ